jgi:hypothetical protein
MVSDELRATNGHGNGRAVADMPTITLSSGYTVGLRRQPGDAWAHAQAAAQAELADTKPQPPMQSLETEPGVFREIANESDPSYLLALGEWRNQVSALMTQKLLLLMQKFALVFEVDQDKLKELRDTYAELGMKLPENDRAVFLGYILAPTLADQAHLFEEVYGKGMPTEGQVALHRAMFPGDVEGHAT